MQVADVETLVVANPPPAHGGRYFTLVKVTTEDGIVGWGEAYGDTFRPAVMGAAIADLADQYLIGTDPRSVERFWRRAYSRGFTQRPDVTLSAAASALEIACWDIVGKATGQPVWQLLGGRVHESLRAYTYLYPTDDLPDVYTDPRQAAEAAGRAVAAGFTAVKCDPAGPYTAMGGHQPSLMRLDTVERFVATIRGAVGDRADILVGTHGQFTASGALRLARRLEAYDPLWFEEPVPPDDIAAMAQVAAGTSIPIATGERLTSKYEFGPLLAARAAGIVQPNVARAGGLWESKKIATLAETFGAQVAPHCYNGPVGLAANMTLAVTAPNLLIVESIDADRDDSFHHSLLQRRIGFDDGRLLVTEEPGLGIEVDEQVARANLYDGDDLHLELWDAPIDEAEGTDR